jgi:hypothetical protein
MGDSYSEVLVKKQITLTDRLKKGTLILLFILAAFAGLFIHVYFFLAAILLGAAAFFLLPTFDMEYEYLLINRELDIDKIYSKSKRKKAAQFHLDEMELFAPLDSQRMEYHNSNTRLRIKDYSSGLKDAKIYGMIIRDDRELCKVLLEPDGQMIETLRKTYPNKVFVD